MQVELKTLWSDVFCLPDGEKGRRRRHLAETTTWMRPELYRESYTRRRVRDRWVLEPSAILHDVVAPHGVSSQGHEVGIRSEAIDG